MVMLSHGSPRSRASSDGTVVASDVQPTPKATEAPVVDMQTRWLQKQLADELGQKVAIRTRKGGGRRLDIDFNDLEQLQGALRKIEALIEQVRSTAGPRVRDVAK